jgi:hypothetical protein
MSERPEVTRGLKKVLGFGSLFIITIGLVVSQASVVSILQGAGFGGGTSRKAFEKLLWKQPSESLSNE